MRHLFATLLLLFVFGSAVAQEQPKIKVWTTSEICELHAQFANQFSNNYLVAGFDKEAQMNHVRGVYEKIPFIEGFEPGIIKSLDVLEKLRPTLDKVTEENITDTNHKFAQATYDACMADGAKGWIKATKYTIPMKSSEKQGVAI